MVSYIVLLGVLLLYVALLVQIRVRRIQRARALRVHRARAAAAAAGFERVPVAALRRTMANGNRNGHSNGRGNGNGHSNGNGHAHSRYRSHDDGHDDPDAYADAGLRILDDDVHVVIRRSSGAVTG